MNLWPCTRVCVHCVRGVTDVPRVRAYVGVCMRVRECACVRERARARVRLHVRAVCVRMCACAHCGTLGDELSVAGAGRSPMAFDPAR